MRLEHQLVLNRFFHSLLGVDDFGPLKELGRQNEGIDSDGNSFFYGQIKGWSLDKELKERISEYDSHVMSYEAQLAKARGKFQFKYFQYLALLYTEIFLDRLVDNPNLLLADLNSFLDKCRKREGTFDQFEGFEADDLRRLAFFMATGSGKTLLLHVNLWQILHYLKNGKHPEALIKRSDGHREFDSLLLITPNEGLSRQHLDEFKLSGIDASLLVEDRGRQLSIRPRVKIIEVHKLAEEASKDGVSIVMDELGSNNLVIVDEGHKGTGSEAQTWKNRQKRLSENGFLFEYSATFAQAISAAGKGAREGLISEYGKTIIFDYSYRHFYEDGYGKEFRVMNLKKAREKDAHEILLGGLLTYYLQLKHFTEKADTLHAYNLEKPLWVFLGSSVNAVYSRGGRKQSDVATVVQFVARVLEDRKWTTQALRRILDGKSGFVDSDTSTDLFQKVTKELKGTDADTLYAELTKLICGGMGGLEVWELKNAEGEFGLRVSSPEGKESPYFGVVNIGDVSSFKKHLSEALGISVKEDQFSKSLFQQVNSPESKISLLIGSKKFIEGWSSWRVSSMGLLNMGKGEGPQVIQLFGRGVRLKGKNWTLKRSSHITELGPHPEGIGDLETLQIFGWNADYIEAFREMIEKEEILKEIQIPLQLYKPFPHLPIPQPKKGYRVESETWILTAENPYVTLDLTPEVAYMAGLKDDTTLHAGASTVIDFSDEMHAALLDGQKLYADLLEYKSLRGYGNVFIRHKELMPILSRCTLRIAQEDSKDLEFLQSAAQRLLRTYLDRFIARKEREAESRNMEPGVLVAKEGVAAYYVVRLPDEILKQVEELKKHKKILMASGEKPLPRLYIERHLYNPILLDPAEYGMEDVSVSPPGLKKNERKFVEDIIKFWGDHRHDPEFKDIEVTLLRNLPKVGVGFFKKSGFYPDFIVWLKNKKTKETIVRFIEPHGMHHGGLSGNQDKIDSLKELSEISKEDKFKKKKIRLDGFILTDTELANIPGAEKLTWDKMKNEFRVVRQEAKYCQALVSVRE